MEKTMKLTNGSPDLTGFGFFDFQEVLEKEMTKFVKLVLEQAPPEIEMPYGLTVGNPIIDGQSSIGFKPEHPLTVRLYLKSFNPDDGTSIQYEDTISAMIDRIIKRKPSKETLLTLRNFLDIEMKKIDKAIENWQEKTNDDED